jgi:hypothetical protein
LYEIRVWGGGVDGFDFNAPAGACYTPGGPSNQPVYLGNGKTPLAGSNLDLSSYNSCAPPLDSDGDGLSNAQETALGTNPFVADTDGGGVDDGTEVQSGTNPLNPSDDNIGASDVCGDPGINNNSDTGTYLWKDCDGSERWHLRVARGGIQSGQQYIGRVQIPGGPLSLSPYNLEASDVLDNSSNSNRISYVLNVWGLGIDGFDFTPRANSCFTPEDPLSESVYLGASRIVMAPASLNLSTLDGC